jgi:FCD domain
VLLTTLCSVANALSITAGQASPTAGSLKALCLSRSIEQGGVDWETAVVAALHRLSRTPYWAGANDRRLCEEWATAHHAFHEALVGANGSLHLTRFRSSLYQQSERYRLSVPVFPKTRDVETEHHEIAEADSELGFPQVWLNRLALIMTFTPQPRESAWGWPSLAGHGRI